MNKVYLIGRMTKDAEIRTTQNQTMVATFTLAVDRRFKDKDGQRQADFISCVAWRQTADFLSRYATKGSKIAVCGEIQTRNYDKDGKKIYVTEVVVDEVEFAEAKAESKNEPKQKVKEPPVEEAPFDL